MQPTKEVKYILCSENAKGQGAIHREAICHMAYATALDALGVSNLLTSDQIRKFTSKKATFTHTVEGIDLDIHIPIRRDTDVYELMHKAQQEIQQNFLDFLSIKVRKVNLIVDQVLF